MADQNDDFLARWARRKAAAGEPEPAPAETAPPEEAETAGALDEAQQKALIESLPDIETLDEKSDFSAFMQEGVPDALRRRALRRLWRVNPIFANLDGLNDYDDDFTDAALVVEGMKTLFQVGKGMADRTAPAEGEIQPEGEIAAHETATGETATGETASDEAAADEAEAGDESMPEPQIAETDESEALAAPSEAAAMPVAPIEGSEPAEAVAMPVEQVASQEPPSRPARVRRWGLPES